MERVAVRAEGQSPSAKAGSIPADASGGSSASAGGNRRRERPPLRYTEDFETPKEVSLDVIGVVRSPYKERFGTPRQPNVTQHTLGNEAQSATIELYPDKQFDLALRGLADFEYCWCITFFHLNEGWNPLVRPPRGPRKKQGVFATRSPHHPNPIGLSCLRITGVDETRRIVRVRGVDLLDGTAVLDIKPCTYFTSRTLFAKECIQCKFQILTISFLIRGNNFLLL